jgi:V/A-type H+-transporting ATPase subunit E
MEYYNDDSLLRYFHEEIERVSSRKIAALQKEISEKKQEELAKLSLEVKHQVELSLGVELKDMRKKYRQDINDILSKNAKILYTVGSSIPQKDMTFFIGPSDETCRKVIINQFGKTAKIENDPAITIGGFKVVSDAMKLEIDETLDSKLENNKTWFFANSKLFIKN